MQKTKTKAIRNRSINQVMKPINLSRISLIFLLRPNPVSPSTTTLSILLHSKPKLSSLKHPLRPFSTASTPYPLQYVMIISRPSHSSSPSQPRRRPKQLPQSNPTDLPESGPDSELGFDDWVDRKLTYPSSETENLRPNLGDSEMDKSKRKYYSKRRKRMYGSDSDDTGNRRLLMLSYFPLIYFLAKNRIVDKLIPSLCNF